MSDEDPSAGSAPPPDSNSSPPKQSRSGKGSSFTSWGTSLLRGGGKKDSPTPSTLMSATGPQKSSPVSNLLEEEHNSCIRSEGGSPSHCDERSSGEFKEGRLSDESAEIRGKEKGSTESEKVDNINTNNNCNNNKSKLTSTNPFEHQIAVLVSTLGAYWLRMLF